MNANEGDSRWPQAITPHFGMAVEGEMRFPRRELEAEFESALTGGSGATLFGLRRTGKSSEALACAQRLRRSAVRSRDWTAAHTSALLDESAAFYPAILQRGFQQVTIGIGGKAAALERFSDLFALKVRPDLDAAFFPQFDNRVRQYRKLSDPLVRLLPQLLETAMNASTPISRDDLKKSVTNECAEADLSDALLILQEDGFLTPRIEKGGHQTWRAASTLVTAWWIQRRGGARP